jgi:PAS domain S-box-containing protein
MESELRQVVDALPGLIWTALPNGDVDSLNQRWCDYTGQTESESIRQGWTAAVHAADLPALDARWRSIVISGEPFEAEARLKRSDGTYRWFLIRAFPITDAAGTVTKWCGMNVDIEDRKRSELGFRLIVETTPECVKVVARDGTVLSVNSAGVAMAGAPSACVVVGQSFFNFVVPEDRARYREFHERVCAGEKGFLEFDIITAQGERRHMETHAAPLQNDDGSIVQLGVSRDITMRRRSERQLAGEKQLLEMIAAGRGLRDILAAICKFMEAGLPDSTCGIYPIDWSGPAFRGGVAPSLPASYTEPVEGLPVRRETAPCGIAAFDKIQVIAEDMATDARWDGSSYQQHVIDHGLKSVWSTPIFSSEGNVLGTFCVYHRTAGAPTAQHQELISHLTHLASIAIERSQAEAALRRSEMMLAQGQLASKTGTYLWRMDTDEFTGSAEFRRIFELGPDQHATLAMLMEMIHPEDAASVANRLELQRHDGVTSYETRLRLPDGRIKYLRTFSHVQERDGRIERLGAIQDITEQRVAENALDRVRSELARVTRSMSLGALTASIAHEVYQPLSGIITNAGACLRMLAKDPPDIDGARETARRTIRDGNRASEVISRLRDMFAKKATAIEDVDLNEATREVIALSSNELQQNRVSVAVHLSDDLPDVAGDRVQLQQVILNLMLNASDAMANVVGPRQMAITTARDANGNALLTVRDAGVGIDPETASQMFEVFHTTKTGSMGVGLSVSRAIIERHHGKLWAQQNEGPGATFSFYVPVVPVEL